MNKQRGSTIIEIMIALIVVAIGVVALVKFQGDILRHRGEVTQHTQALQIARDKLDEFRHYVTVNTTAGVLAYQDITNGSGTVTGNNVSYTVTWTVNEVTDPPHKVVRVTVSWTNAANQQQSVVVDGIIARHDNQQSGKVMQDL